MRKIELTLGDIVGVDNSGLLIGSVASIVGSPPIWKDGSDATYAEIVTQMNGPGQPQFGSNAGCSISAPVDLPTLPPLPPIARIRVAAMEADLPYPTISLERSGAAVGGSLPGVCPTAPTWVDIPCETGAVDIFRVEPGTFTFSVDSGFKSEAGGEKFWRIYEAKLFVQARSLDAPPCRILPRRDGLGVGAGVAFPPPRSQQRSPGNRGVGYY